MLPYALNYGILAIHKLSLIGKESDMNDFQRYLDDALDRLDVKDTAQMTAGTEDRTDYSIEKDISELLLA